MSAQATSAPASATAQVNVGNKLIAEGTEQDGNDQRESPQHHHPGNGRDRNRDEHIRSAGKAPGGPAVPGPLPLLSGLPQCVVSSDGFHPERPVT
jgi:hypothetical protein